MRHVNTIEVSVPRWEVVRQHGEHDQRWPADPPPDLSEAHQHALEGKRILTGTFVRGDDVEHPYVIGGAVDTYYAYPNEPEGRRISSLGRIERSYGFYSTKPPKDLDLLYDYDPKDVDFEIVVTPNDHMVLVMKAGEIMHKLTIGEPGDDVSTSMIRAAVAVHILDSLDDIKRFDILPYEQDTPPIAHARLKHVMAWQFEKSRTKPLFA